MAALGLYLANSRNDADYSKATALLEFLRRSVSQSTAHLSEDARTSATKYSDALVTTLAANLKNMRGESGHAH